MYIIRLPLILFAVLLYILRILVLRCIDRILLIALHIAHSAANVRSHLRRAAGLRIALHNVTLHVNIQNAQPWYAEQC